MNSTDPPKIKAPAVGAGEAQADGLPSPRRYWAALAVRLAETNDGARRGRRQRALPTISGELRVSPASAIAGTRSTVDVLICGALIAAAAAGVSLLRARLRLPGSALG